LFAAAPAFTSVTAYNTGSATSVYGAGDTIQIVFNSNTDKGKTATSLTKSQVDALFTASQVLGANYVGTWLSATTFEITIIDATGALPPRIGQLTFTVASPIRKVEADSTVCPSLNGVASPVISGSFATAPAISSVVASNIPADSVFGANDKFTITFDKAVVAVAVATKANLDALLQWNNCSLGTDYTGSWTSSSVLAITIVNAASANPPKIGAVNSVQIKPAAGLTDAAITSAVSAATSPALSGSFATGLLCFVCLVRLRFNSF
jgi:hypothetical protein